MLRASAALRYLRPGAVWSVPNQPTGRRVQLVRLFSSKGPQNPENLLKKDTQSTGTATLSATSAPQASPAAVPAAKGTPEGSQNTTQAAGSTKGTADGPGKSAKGPNGNKPAGGELKLPPGSVPKWLEGALNRRGDVGECS